MTDSDTDNSIAVYIDNNAEQSSSSSDCCICMDLKATQVVGVCEHRACPECLQKIDRCPLCRGDLFPEIIASQQERQLLEPTTLHQRHLVVLFVCKVSLMILAILLIIDFTIWITEDTNTSDYQKRPFEFMFIILLMCALSLIICRLSRRH